MAINKSLIVSIAPELESVETNRVNLFIELAKQHVNESVFGSKYEIAVGLITAHYLTMSERGGASGAVTSEKAGQLQVSYGQTMIQNQEEFSQTSYGVMYLNLRKTIIVTPIVV